jgi:hypothetical protein
VGINYGSVYRWIAGNGFKDGWELAKLDKKRTYNKQAQGFFIDGKGNEKYRIGKGVYNREELLSKARSFNVNVNSVGSLEELGDAVALGQQAYYDEVDSINKRKQKEREIRKK